MKTQTDQFYTKEIVCEKLVDILYNNFELSKYDVIIEPSAGTGNFLKAFEKFNLNSRILSYDIEPKHNNIEAGNFLDKKVPNESKIAVIGNPPFGHQSCLARKFIKHSCGFAKMIAFILPLSFKKDSMIKCFDRNFHKIYQQDLEIDSFIFENNSYSVPCVFQVWTRKEFPRLHPTKIKENEYYKFVEHDALSQAKVDLSFRRVGWNAGTFYFENGNVSLKSLSSNSHYFIHYKHQLTEIQKTKLNEIKWNDNNTVAQKSISKQELISQLNKILI